MKSTAQVLGLLSASIASVHAHPHPQGAACNALENCPGPYSFAPAPVWGGGAAGNNPRPVSTTRPAAVPSSTPAAVAAQPATSTTPAAAPQPVSTGTGSLESSPGPYTFDPAPIWDEKDPADRIQAAAYKKAQDWQKQHNEYVFKQLEGRTSGCTKDKLQYRREWSSLTKEERIKYTTAVQCLQKKPNKISNEEIPGARSRFDDVIATHILQTLHIHFSGLFLHWHRMYMYIYDKMLREECDYTGPTPYWDWTTTYKDPRKSKIFDGSVDSMGSNGESIPHGSLNTFAFPGHNFTVPPGTGGGCVTDGPFKDYVVNLGPAAFEPRVGDGSGKDYNPRCLKRDVSLDFANGTQPTDVVKAIDGKETLEAFAAAVEGGVHGNGHFTIGGDPGADAKVSAGDPIFYLHHSQIDRLWTIWQALDPKTRFGDVYGTSTAFNEPPSANVTLETELIFDAISEPVTMKSVDSTIDGPFCYIYV